MSTHFFRTDKKPLGLRIQILLASCLITLAAWQLSPSQAQQGITLPTPETTNTNSQKTFMQYDIPIQKGDSLYLLFKQHHISQKQLQILIKSDKKKLKPLLQLKPGQALTLNVDADGTLDHLSYTITHDKTLIAIRDNNTFHITTKNISLSTSPVSYTTVSGTIEHSLYQDTTQSGLPARLVQPLANIFAWQVDLSKSIHPGDTFQITFEQNKDDTPHSGRIVAAAIQQHKHRHEAIYFENSLGDGAYYAPTGKSLSPKFIRYPVKYSHISDHFNPKRKHPILHTVRPHWGVDFAAKSGTPIHATSDGKITYLGSKGGFGRFIEIKHQQGYITRYAHLSRYNKSLKKGSHVKQNQVIGYVGRTGLSTGSHLHYEIRIHGQAKDPLKVKLPQGNPIAAKDNDSFARFRDSVWPIKG
jgi:murein DD-endopeptidase MepM/ murein hydrolase activator NlpD